MRRLVVGRMLVACTLALCSVSAFAVSLGTDITYFDNRIGTSSNSTYNDWWNGGSPDPRVREGLAVGEDQETEPNTQYGQNWDMEGMYLSGSVLSLVGGYNFYSGVSGLNTGDIFFDINPTFAPTNTAGSTEPPNTAGAGYDFVIDISPAVDPGLGDTGGGSPYHYTVYAISGLTVGSGLLGATDFPQSNPWRLDNNWVLQDGQVRQAIATGTFTMTTYGSDAALGVGWNSGYLPTGGTHYVLSGFNLSFLNGSSFYAHYTMECGNDVLTGLVVPEPSTYVLFGLGLAALAARKKFAKAA